MSKFFRRKESQTQKPGGFLANLQKVNSLFKWLTGLARLTEEEKLAAGIYPGHRR